MNQTCLNCGGDLGRNKYYCSQKCRAEYIRNRKKCVICGKYFYASPSSEKKTCSKACEKIERAAIGKIGKSAHNLISAQKAAVLSPNACFYPNNENGYKAYFDECVAGLNDEGQLPIT